MNVNGGKESTHLQCPAYVFYIVDMLIHIKISIQRLHRFSQLNINTWFLSYKTQKFPEKINRSNI